MSHKQSTAKLDPSGEGEPKTRSADVALIRGRTPDGEGLTIFRQRNDQLEVGAIKPLKEGVPIQGEVVTLRPRPEFPLLCDVDVAYTPPRAPARDVPKREAAPRKGPAQVATDDYRQNWDAIWKRSAKKPALAN